MPRVLFCRCCLAIDLHELYWPGGMFFFPSMHNSDDVPGIYRQVADSVGGNHQSSLTEPASVSPCWRRPPADYCCGHRERWPRRTSIATAETGFLVDPLELTGRSPVPLKQLLTDQATLATLPPATALRHSRATIHWDAHAASYPGSGIRPISLGRRPVSPRAVSLSSGRQNRPPPRPVHAMRQAHCCDCRSLCANSYPKTVRRTRRHSSSHRPTGRRL